MGFVVPAVLPVSRQELEKKLDFFARVPSVERIQIDVVDGHLASPASWPYNTRDWKLETRSWKEMLPKIDQLDYEIDLMCLDAEEAAGVWLELGASRLTFHIESVVAAPNFINGVRHRYGGGVEFSLSHLLSVGIALNIETDLRIVEPYLADADYIQFMGIAKIGRQGQKFDPRVFDQIRAFRSLHPHIPVQVDGGVTLERAKELLALGVSNVVVGSAILEAEDPVAAISAFQALQSHYGV